MISELRVASRPAVSMTRDFEEVLTALGGSGQIAADGAELSGTGEVAQAAGHNQSWLDHANVAL